MYIKRTFNVYPDKQRDGRLRFLVKWDNGKTKLFFDVGFKVNIEKWSTGTQRCTNNSFHTNKKIPSATINREIQRYEDAINKVFLEFEHNGTIPTKDELRNGVKIILGRNLGSIKPISSTSLLYVFDKFTEIQGFQNTWSEDTFEKFRAIRSHLYNFDKDLHIDDLTENKMTLYMRHLINLGFKNSTITKHFSFIRWFLRWAANSGYYSGNLHDTFKPKLKGTSGEKQIIFLKWDELIKMYEYDFSSRPYIETTRDVFCFLCFTGLRYSDVAKLTKSDIFDDHIKVITKKTADGITIELNDFSRAILDKYKDFQSQKGLALPVTSDQKMNDNIKVIGKILEIDEQIRKVYFNGNERIEEVKPKWELLSTHAGRRTFVVNAMALKIPTEVIMKWTGHATYASMKPYMSVVDELKRKEMDKFNHVAHGQQNIDN